MRVTEALLTFQQGIPIDRFDRVRFGQRLNGRVFVFEPGGERVLADILLLEFLIVDYTALFGIDEEDAARVQAFFDFDVLRR